jgi:hypothetical protein
MVDESSTFGLKREKLAALWKLGKSDSAGSDPPGAEPAQTAWIEAHLAKSLPLDAGLAHLLPNILTLVCEKLRPFTGCSFRALLADPQTDVSVLETINDLYKKQAESAPAGPPREAATAIYYAAIASALIHHEARITKLSYRSLSQSFAELARSAWLPADLQQSFTRAHEISTLHMKKEET